MFRLMALGGIILIVGSLYYIFQSVGHIPPYDANLVRLAENDLEGYCSGRTFMSTQGVGDAAIASRCRVQYEAYKSENPNMLIVQRSFCRGIVVMGWGGTINQCLQVMQMNEYWPTYDGSITNQWNRARPYPRPLAGSAASSQNGDSSRTGQHQGYTHPNFTH